MLFVFLLPPSVSAQNCVSKSGAPWQEWIARVQFSNMDNASEKTRPDRYEIGYSDWKDKTATVMKGQSYPLSITPGLSYATYPTNLFTRVWIDYNRNGTFEDTEKILEQNNGNALVNQSVTIPTTVTNGTTTLRVSTKKDAYPTACETFAAGEVEDYTVQITEGVQNNLPDLNITTIFVLNTPVRGQVFNWRVDIQNIGTAAATGNFSVKAYISTNLRLDATDIQDGIIETGNYAAGQRVNFVRGSSTLPFTLAPGQYYLILKVDADNQIQESNEDNNESLALSPFTVMAANESDLTLANLTVANPSVPQGFILNSKVDVKNVGTTTISSSYKTKAYLSTDNILSANDVVIDSIFGWYLLSGETRQSPSAGVVPNTLPVGQYFLILKTDANAQIAESNENNNEIVSATPISITAKPVDTGCGFDKTLSGYLGNANQLEETDNHTIKFRTSGSIYVSQVGKYVHRELELDNLGNLIHESQDTFTPRFTSTYRTLDAHYVYPTDLKDSSFVFNKIATNGTIVFSKTITFSHTQKPFGAIKINGIASFSDHYIAFGTTAYQLRPNSEPHMSVFMIKLDLNGNKIGQSLLTTNSTWVSPYQVQLEPSGSYYCVLRSYSVIQLIKTDNAGTQLWFKDIVGDLPSSGLVSIHESSDNTGVFVTRNDNGSAYTTKLNAATGNIDWTANYVQRLPFDSGNIFTRVRGTASTKDGGFIAGYISKDNYVYARFDANGNPVWFKKMSANFRIGDGYGKGVALAMSDGSFVFSGSKNEHWNILKTTSNGDILPNCLTNLPDLTLANLTVSTPSVPKSQILTWKVDAKNSGTAAVTGLFNIKAYISKDTILSADDVQDGVIPTGNYAAGLVQTQIAGASTIPTWIGTGEYYLIVKIDANADITESDETNNTVVSATRFTVTSEPIDLYPENLKEYSNGAISVSSGSHFRFTYVVNAVNGAIATTEAAYYLSDARIDNPTRSQLIPIGNRRTINLTETSTGVLDSFIMPAFTGITEYNYWVEIDPNNIITESIEVNNLRKNLGRAIILTQGLPDFAVQNVVVTNTPRIGGVISVKYEYINIGQSEYCSNIDNIRYYVSRDSIFSGGYSGRVAPLNRTLNTLFRGTYDITAPLSGIGKYYLTIVANPENLCQESNVHNNAQTIPFSIQPKESPDLEVSLAMQRSGNSFTTFTYTIYANNLGNQAFTNAVIEFKYPTGTVSGGQVIPSVGTWKEWCEGGVQCCQWTIPNLAVNATETLHLPLYVLNPPMIVTTAKLLSSTPIDNILYNNTSTLIVRATDASAPIQALTRVKPTKSTSVLIQSINPTITEGRISVEIASFIDQTVRFDFYDLLGRILKTEQKTIQKGINSIPFEVFDLPKGVYLIQPKTTVARNVPLKFIKM
ncbi:MAG: CARDB domain-containing protein [Saprospiraceae bacterium]|nr:CARDB domain-containing protein [Saprospiraceae bacterium]